MATIPALYRVWFSMVDPVLTVMGVLGNLFGHEAMLDSYTPAFTSPPTPETTLLMYLVAGFFACLLCLQIWILVLTRPADLNVWRAIQASIVIVDFTFLGAITRTLAVEGRLDPFGWRAGEWVNISITGWVAILRVSFLLGIGFDNKAGKRKEV